jgi:hypothetical protein
MPFSLGPPRQYLTTFKRLGKWRGMGKLLHYLPMPVLGPWGLHSHLGMDAAVMVLMRSMEKGKTGGTVKYGMARKACATLTILWESSPSGGDDLTLSAGSI